MSHSVTASNIPSNITKTRVEEFFAFCGKIDSVDLVCTNNVDETATFTVRFVSESAVSTALLLNQAELGGKAVKVESELTPETLAKLKEEDEDLYAATTIHKQVSPYSPGRSPHSPGGSPADIAQESKPKAAIFAQYLSQGYVLGDHLIQKAVDYDKQNGLSVKFKRFLNDLDSKYALQEKSRDFQNKQQEMENKYKIGSSISHYYDRAVKTGAGSKLHSFYTSVVKDATQVHEEAKRLAQIEIEKRQVSQQGHQ